MNEFKPIEGQIAVVQREKEVLVFERDAYNAKAGWLHALLSRYRDACYYVAKRSRDERVHLKANWMAAGNKADEEVTQFLRGLVLLMKDCEGKHCAHTLPFVKKRSSMVTELLRSKMGELQEIFHSQSIFGDDPLDISCIPTSVSSYSYETRVVTCLQYLTILVWMLVFRVCICIIRIRIAFVRQSIENQHFLPWAPVLQNGDFADCGVTRCHISPNVSRKEKRTVSPHTNFQIVSNWIGIYLWISESLY